MELANLTREDWEILEGYIIKYDPIWFNTTLIGKLRTIREVYIRKPFPPSKGLTNFMEHNNRVHDTLLEYFDFPFREIPLRVNLIETPLERAVLLFRLEKGV